MPSASSKSEKLASTEATDPLKQAIVIIGHKIRNLEKRKSKLDSYKESTNERKALTKEQVEAVSKYDEVVQQLELSREYVKQFTLISVENNKLKKRQARKDALEKYMAEVNKVKQVLLIQDVLQSMGTDSVREDFLGGKNGAIKLTQDDLKTLDDLYVEVSPKRASEEETPSQDQFQKAAEYFMAIIEGKSKEIAGSTGAKLKELVTSIYTCGYFDRPGSEEASKASLAPNTENETVEEEEEFHENQEILSNVIVPTQNPPEGNLAPVPNPAPVQPMIPGPILPGSQPAVMQPNQQQIMGNVPNIVPTPVSQVESSFFNAQGFKPPAPPSVVPPPNQTTRQINDVIQSVTGKFNFLQESELDLAEMNSGVPGNPPVAPPQIPGGPPSAIPTQTFTNQNFNGQPGAAPAFPPNYPPQPAAFQAFVPAFPTFVTPNATPVQSNNSNTLSNSNNSSSTNSNNNSSSTNNNNSNNNANPTVVGPVNSVNPNIPTSNSNIHSSNKSNNIPNSIPLAPNRNPNVSFNQGQQQITSGFPNQPDTQNMPQTSSQPVFQPGNVTAGSVDNVNNDTVRKETEMKEKQENEKQDWSQAESTNWADECVDTSEWNPSNQNQSDGPTNGNKFSSGRPNRNVGGVPRNSNGYQGSRPRTHRQGGYRDPQTTSNPGGSSNYYQNQNGYQSRNERTNEFPVGGKGNSDLRDGTFKERGDFNSRDREPRENYGGGFKRGPTNRGPNMKGPMDRGDRQGQIQRNNPGGPRGPRNVNRQSNGRNGSSFQRQQPNTVGQAPNK